MKRKLVSLTVIGVLVALPLLAACAAPVEPGVVDVAKLQKEIASLKKEVASGEKEIASLKGKITTAEAKASTSEKEAAASKKEIAAAEKEIAALEKEKTAAEKEIAALEGKVSTAEKEIAKLEAAAPEPVEVIEWKFNAWAARGLFPCDEIDRHFIDTIEAMSGGRLTIKFYGVGELMEADEVFTATRKGVVDLGTSCGYHVGELPVNEVEYALPLTMTRFYEHHILWHDLGLYEFMRDEVYLQHNLWLLPPQIVVPIPITMSKEEITTLADIEGMKIRAYGSQATMLEKFGATLVWVPFAELYTGLATGVIDAAGCPSISEYTDLKLYEMAKWLVLPYMMPNVCISVFANSDSWNPLPDDLKATITIAAMESSMFSNRVYMSRDAEGMIIMKEAGVTFVTLPPEDVAEFRIVAEEVWDELAAKGPDFAEVIRLHREALEYFGY